jgi:hypothetical protein
MPQANIFRWRAGTGWLVLSGGGPRDSEAVLDIEAKMLNHTVSLGPLAYIWTADDIDTADWHMDAMRDLGARTGYLVDIMTEDDETLIRQLGEAGVIVLGDGPRQHELRQALDGAPIHSIETAFDRGATVYAIGHSAAMLAAYSLSGETPTPALNWLADSIILPGYKVDQAERLRRSVYQQPDSYGLGLGQEAALALGPNGEVQIWGDPAAVTISLGQHFNTDSD